MEHPFPRGESGDGPYVSVSSLRTISMHWADRCSEYEIYFNDDQSGCIVLERYRDSGALIEHGAHIGDLMEAIVARALSPANPR
jgi:hypothetical protein